MLQRRTALKRTAMKRRNLQPSTPAKRERTVPVYAPVARRGVISRVSGEVVAVPKENTVKCEAYRRLVASLPCVHCGLVGWSQAAHPNTGKAMGKKLVDDRLCFPLCTVHSVGSDLVPGCHEKFDQGALFVKEDRRQAEISWGNQTRSEIVRNGKWPAGLAMWEE